MWILLVFALNARALDTTASAIEQAQNLALKKNRKDACATLVHALAQTPPPGKAARAKLSEALANISKVFFTDKGQRAYEAGQSQMFENPDMAMTQFHDALAVEDDNLAILNSVTKIQLAKGDCDAAATTIAQARALNPFAGEPAVLELRALLCQNSFEQLREKARALPPLEKWEEQYAQYLLAQDALQNGSSKKALDTLIKISEEQPQFPETYVYLAKAGSELNRENEAYLQKYISLCKAVTPKERKRFSLEPRLCARMKEAQDELAKKSTDL